MFGTTNFGGTKGEGTIYEIHTDGTEVVLYSFKSAGRQKSLGPDGYRPGSSGPLFFDGVLVGTTYLGGANDRGVFYEVNRGYKTEEFINPVGANPDGAHSRAPLTLLDSVFYGTTEAGGDNDKGCVYKINADGSQHVVYSFKGGSGDGAVPNAGLTVLNVVLSSGLFGTTLMGGVNNDGTVFELVP